jgi:tRNA threonylcarbamoyladenosine biosynthesis protein TsaB
MERAMRVVAIETSGRQASVATLLGESDEANLIGQIALTSDERTAQALAPALQKLLAEIGWSPKSIELVAVAIGPGSFTGLRIGVTTAKTFAYAVEAEVIGVNTLEALAVQTPSSSAPLWTILDAQRQELFASRFIADGENRMHVNRETCIIPQDAWLAELRPGDHVTGTALNRLVPKIPAGVDVVSAELWQPMAAAVGRVAWNAYRTGQRGHVWKLTPQYYRSSAAEEKATRRI